MLTRLSHKLEETETEKALRNVVGIESGIPPIQRDPIVAVEA
jgi:hypothetical protein